ncbi:MAG: hypothetical protein ACE14P_05425 [Methanotrichaceae archaeon]
MGRILKNIPYGTVIGFWDVGPNVGVYDGDDIIYLDTPPIGIVNANDLRLSPFEGYSAGTKVTPSDNDINSPLESISAEIRFLNLNGSQSYDINDPVYLHQSNTQYLNGISEGASSSTNEPMNSAKTADSTTCSAASAAANCIPCMNEGFYEWLSNAGHCSNLPRGSVCLIYSDSFAWTVSDYPINNNPYFAGYDSNGRPIEAIGCNNADYYHILGTSLVKSIPRQKTLLIQSLPCQCATNIDNYPENTGFAAQPNTQSNAQPYNHQDGTSKVINALNRISANLDPIRSNDVTLTGIGYYPPGSKVKNFDPDLDKFVLPLILASFPGRSDDYACIRIYDANGNGLYDFPDNVYLDISLPGDSSFGTVSVNDVRLSDVII